MPQGESGGGGPLTRTLPPLNRALAGGGREAWPVNRRRVMVVEDDAMIRETLAEALDEEGFEVIEAANGREALDKLQGERTSLVLLDLMMPVMDGWQFREAQLRDEELADIPVVVLSAVRDDRVPAVRHFSKPCDLGDLIDTVREFTGGP